MRAGAASLWLTADFPAPAQYPAPGELHAHLLTENGGVTALKPVPSGRGRFLSITEQAEVVDVP